MFHINTTFPQSLSCGLEFPSPFVSPPIESSRYDVKYTGATLVPFTIKFPSFSTTIPHLEETSSQETGSISGENDLIIIPASIVSVTPAGTITFVFFNTIISAERFPVFPQWSFIPVWIISSGWLHSYTIGAIWVLVVSPSDAKTSTDGINWETKRQKSKRLLIVFLNKRDIICRPIDENKAMNGKNEKIKYAHIL